MIFRAGQGRERPGIDKLLVIFIIYSNAPRIPPSQYLWLGGLEGMRDWRAWRGTGIGEAGLGRTQQLSSKQWSKAIRTCWYFVRILMHFGQNYWKICLGRRLGGPKSQKMLPRQGTASKIEDRRVSRLRQGSWKLSPDWPKRGQGEAN